MIKRNKLVGLATQMLRNIVTDLHWQQARKIVLIWRGLGESVRKLGVALFWFAKRLQARSYLQLAIKMRYMEKENEHFKALRRLCRNQRRREILHCIRILLGRWKRIITEMRSALKRIGGMVQLQVLRLVVQTWRRFAFRNVKDGCRRTVLGLKRVCWHAFLPYTVPAAVKF